MVAKAPHSYEALRMTTAIKTARVEHEDAAPPTRQLNARQSFTRYSCLGRRARRPPSWRTAWKAPSLWRLEDKAVDRDGMTKCRMVAGVGYIAIPTISEALFSYRRAA